MRPELRCAQCGDYDGPFVRAARRVLCEDCDRASFWRRVWSVLARTAPAFRPPNP